MDETSTKIINAMMELVMEKGYSSTTTKDIAKKAKVNECTIFRKFSGKKDIVLSAMSQDGWKPDIKETDFEQLTGNIESDLEHFATVYMDKVTPRFVKISIGLRTPELYQETAPGIMEIPKVFKQSLIKYLTNMYEKGIIKNSNIEELAMMFLSMCFGYVFLKASFKDKLTEVEKEEFISVSVASFIHGIC